MALKSARFKDNERLQRAAQNHPPVRWPERGPAVAVLQQALLDLGFPMPLSMRQGSPDGIFGNETLKTVRDFQARYRLKVDGIAGRHTLEKLDELLPSAPPRKESLIPYSVPGLKTVLSQPSPMSCWATVYCMMRSWKDQVSYPIRDAVLRVGQKWADYYDQSYPPTNQGLPADQFGPFLREAGMDHEPMANLTIEQWARLLRTYGLLWIGASVTVNPNTGLHSRILEGITGNGEPASTFMKIIDPDGGRQYSEAFMVFLAKYESGIRSVSGEYFQIRRFR
jgi:peptidoglycan hydrolase-like protein with peptidoglycan-binding domain